MSETQQTTQPVKVFEQPKYFPPTLEMTNNTKDCVNDWNQSTRHHADQFGHPTLMMTMNTKDCVNDWNEARGNMGAVFGTNQPLIK